MCANCECAHAPGGDNAHTHKKTSISAVKYSNTSHTHTHIRCACNHIEINDVDGDDDGDGMWISDLCAGCASFNSHHQLKPDQSTSHTHIIKCVVLCSSL